MITNGVSQITSTIQSFGRILLYIYTLLSQTIIYFNCYFFVFVFTAPKKPQNETSAQVTVPVSSCK